MPTPDLGITHDVYANYGLWGLLILVLVLFVLPATVKKLMPHVVKGWQDERKRAEQREERQVTAMEGLAKGTQAIAVTLAAMDVRIETIRHDVDCVKSEVLRKKRPSRASQG
jgi:uncharacterized membrane protein